MLWPVTSIACCCASRPRSEVWRPKKAEVTGGSAQAWRSRARSERVSVAATAPWAPGAERIAAGRVRARVAGRGRVDEPQQVVEERQLLAHQRLVARVLARQLGEQAAAARRCGRSRARRRPASSARSAGESVTACGVRAEQRAGADEQRARGPPRARARRSSSAWKAATCAHDRRRRPARGSRRPGASTAWSRR